MPRKQNTSLDPIFAKHEPILAEKLAELNAALDTHTKARSHEGETLREKLVGKLKAKCREEKASALTEADRLRWLLPGTDPQLLQPAKGVLTPKQASDLRAFVSSCEKDWKEWQAPFDADADWPKPLADALTAYRAAWRANYEPDFIVRLCNSVNVVLEIKGQQHQDTGAKHQAAKRWVSAVNHWGRLGEWDFLVCREPQRLGEAFTSLRHPDLTR